jgi:endo-1,4-beta-xylanase
LEESIKKFSSLGLKVQITEMDVSVFQKEHESREKTAKDKLVLTDAILQKQAEHYGKMFEILENTSRSLRVLPFGMLQIIVLG